MGLVDGTAINIPTLNCIGHKRHPSNQDAVTQQNCAGLWYKWALNIYALFKVSSGSETNNEG